MTGISGAYILSFSLVLNIGSTRPLRMHDVAWDRPRSFFFLITSLFDIWFYWQLKSTENEAVALNNFHDCKRTFEFVWFSHVNTISHGRSLKISVWQKRSRNFHTCRPWIHFPSVAQSLRCRPTHLFTLLLCLMTMIDDYSPSHRQPGIKTK